MKGGQSAAREIAALGLQEPIAKMHNISRLKLGQIFRPCIFLNYASASAIFLEGFGLNLLSAISTDLFANLQPARHRFRNGDNTRFRALLQSTEIFGEGAGFLHGIEGGIGVPGFCLLTRVSNLIPNPFGTVSFS